MVKIINRLKPIRRTKKGLVILGAGGIGSNVIRFLGKDSQTAIFRNVQVFEFDDVELSNLNRTSLFRVATVGMDKVDAIPQSLQKYSMLQSGTNFTWKRDRVNKDTAVRNFTERYRTKVYDEGQVIVVDCRDTIDPTLLPPETWMKASYDGGTHISWHFLPAVTNRSIWRIEGGGYDVTPSFYVPAALSGVLIKMLLSFDQFTRLDPEKHSKVVSMDIDEVILSLTRGVADGDDD